MQITNTSIKHKRYSTYGWNVKDQNGNYINTLSQGEMGILLGYKDPNTNNVTRIVTEQDLAWLREEGAHRSFNYVLEVRVGTQDNQYFFDALIVNFEDYGGVKRVDNLPLKGYSDCLYIDKSNNNKLSIWDEETGKFIDVAGNDGSIGDVQSLLKDYVKTDALQSILNQNHYTKSEVDIMFQNIGNSSSAIESIRQSLNDLDTKTSNNLQDLRNNLNNNYYTKSAIDSSIGSLTNNKADKSELNEIRTALEGLASVTRFIGVVDELPGNGVHGDICIVGSKEYIYSTNTWIELGDVSEEKQRLTTAEANITLLQSDLSNKADTSVMNQTILQAKSDVISIINGVESNTSSSIDKALKDAKDYADSLSGNYEVKGAANQVKSELLSEIATNSSNLTSNINEVDAKFGNYYTKSEVNDVVASNSGNLDNIGMIYGWDAKLTPKDEIPTSIHN